MHDLFAFALFGQLTTTFQQKIERERDRDRMKISPNRDAQNQKRVQIRRNQMGWGESCQKIRVVHLSIPKSVVQST